MMRRLPPAVVQQMREKKAREDAQKEQERKEREKHEHPLIRQLNEERAHLAHVPQTRPRRRGDPADRPGGLTMKAAMGHFSKMDTYVPKGKPGRHQGMYISKETGEML
eukprot:TRINITY_DN1443_c0_g1_i1.p2 TRINITY_DN1443_c0_g1~~TRINITY_DN1443_c0_g1_i1.p2  ORF type:complete len:108 (+),score=22.49 TRINITY_DN1443_c0_g1_i1:362-685(+)